MALTCPVQEPSTASKPDVQNYRDLRNLKSVRTSSFPATCFAVVRQHLRGAADAAPKGFIERDAAKPAAVRPAEPVDLPLRGPDGGADIFFHVSALREGDEITE